MTFVVATLPNDGQKRPGPAPALAAAE